MQPSGRGYDHGITTFSPDGRLFQVEYARESVKRGTTTAALKFKDGVVLVCDKRIISRLIIPESIEKMFKIDGHVGIATSGLVADAVIEFFEDNWKENMTLNAAMKLGLEALRSANDAELNREAVEVTVVDSNGYRVLDRGEVNKQIDRLKPLED